MTRRIVTSLSLSERNPAAVAVMEGLRERGIALGRGGGQILAWAELGLIVEGMGGLEGLQRTPMVEGAGIDEDELSRKIDLL